MNINILGIVVVCILAGLAWWANEKLNTIPVLKTVLQVLIVVVAVLLVLENCGLMDRLDTNINVGMNHLDTISVG